MRRQEKLREFLGLKKISEQTISIGIYSIFIFWISLFSYLIYNEAKTTLYNQIDNQILAIARGSVMLLPIDFHDRTEDPSSISAEEDKHNIDRLSQIAKSFKVTYIYTMIQKNGHVYFTTSSATDQEYQTGKNMTHYFDLYEDASPTVMEAFRTHKVVFVEESDKWGTFRSVLVPLKSPSGKMYITGVDIRTDELHHKLNDQAVKQFLFAFGLTFISFPIFLWRHQRIKKLAFFDTLTNLPNRIEFKNRAQSALDLDKRKNETFALMFLDLDGFKEINDMLGHSIGDKLLKQVAQRLQSVLRTTDIPSRQGGDEFVVALPSTNHDGAAIVAQKILEAIAKPYNILENKFNVTFSIGIALYPNDGVDLESLSKNADIAMYQAKNAGRNCYRFFSEHI